MNSNIDKYQESGNRRAHTDNIYSKRQSSRIILDRKTDLPSLAGVSKISAKSFGSGPDNPDGLQLKLLFDEDTKTVYGEYRCDPKFQGEKDSVHPGVLAVILDETMTRINEAMNFDTTTGELTIRYLQPASVGENLHLRGWFVKKNRRVVENRAEIENEIGKIVARGKGKYIEREES